MTLINTEELGRNMYDIRFPQDRLELWPDFVTAVRNPKRTPAVCRSNAQGAADMHHIFLFNKLIVLAGCLKEAS